MEDSNRPAEAASPLGTAEPWDLVATAYTAEALPYFEVFARAALQRAELPTAARIVDVAAGPGTLSLLAAAAGARVSAIDFSARMVEEFRGRAAAAGLAASIDIRQGDGQQLPFETGAYDGAFSMFGLMFFPDRAAGFRELRRVLRPGGRAVVSSWVPFDGPFGELLKAAREVIPGLAPGGGALPLGEPDEFRAEMSAAGFAGVTVETIPQTLEAPSFDVFWSMMERTNAPLVLIKHRLGAGWIQMGPKIRERVRSVLGDGKVVVGRGAYLGVGTCP